jgi:tripartite-type tricarboxylate transporter receptor subunit TctC
MAYENFFIDKRRMKKYYQYHLWEYFFIPLKDLQPIMQFGGFNFGVVAKADSPLKSFKDFIAYARQNPKKVTYGTSGMNSLQNLIMEVITKKEGIQITHIPFRGTPEAQVALLGGHIFAAASDFSYSLHEGGQMRLLLLLSEEVSAEYHCRVFGRRGMPLSLIFCKKPFEPGQGRGRY